MARKYLRIPNSPGKEIIQGSKISLDEEKIGGSQLTGRGDTGEISAHQTMRYMSVRSSSEARRYLRFLRSPGEELLDWVIISPSEKIPEDS
jgi:hypothetical protein